MIAYAPDAALGLLLPKEFTATFEAAHPGAGASNMGTSALNGACGSSAPSKYSNARYMPIDLTKTK